MQGLAGCLMHDCKVVAEEVKYASEWLQVDRPINSLHTSLV